MSVKKILVLIFVVILHIVVLGVVYIYTKEEPDNSNKSKNESELNTNQSGTDHSPKPPVEKVKIPSNEEQFFLYTIEKGDYLGKIANKHKVSVEAIIELNNLKEQDRILPGHKIKIPSQKP